jgi:hypothetical protein
MTGMLGRGRQRSRQQAVVINNTAITAGVGVINNKTRSLGLQSKKRCESGAHHEGQKYF